MFQKNVTASISRAQISLAIRRFVHWWLSELAALLPSRLHSLVQQYDERLVVDIHDSRIMLTECREGQERGLGEFQLDQDGNLSEQGLAILRSAHNKATTALVIRLSRAQFMTRMLTLSSKTEENLREVLGYEMDQVTPFQADHVYYDYKIVKRQPEQQQIEVELVFVPRAKIDWLVQRVREWGGQPAAVTVAEERGENVEQCQISGLNLLPQDQYQENRDPRNIMNRLLAATAITLALVALLFPLLWQKLTINELEQHIASVRPQAGAVQSMQEKIDTLRTESGMILERKQKYPPVIEILNELTRILPDGTWLGRFSMKGAHITIQGFSTDASALIELIENSNLFHDVAFDSPITRDPQTTRYRFQIGADLSPRGGG